MANESNYSRISLYSVLHRMTVPQLKSCAHLMGYKFKSGVRKDRMTAFLAKKMLEHPENILRSAFYHELKAWLDIAEGRKTAEEALEEGYLSELDRFGFVYPFWDPQFIVCIPKELAEKLLPLIPPELERREKDGSLIMEKLTLGCANIYGYTDVVYIFEHDREVEKLLGIRFDDDFINRTMYPVACIDQEPDSDEALPIFSPFAQRVGFEIDPEHINIEVEPKRFDLKTILDMGEMPYPKFPEHCVSKLREALLKFGKDKDVPADAVLRELWIQKQGGMANALIPDLNSIFSFDSMDDAQTSLDSVVNFMNTVPYWCLRGNSSKEIGQQARAKMRGERRMPEIQIGPNMRAMGIESYEQLQEMARRGEDLPPFRSAFDEKVGRNDPCPCGSGKKYKNCCGQ